MLRQIETQNSLKDRYLTSRRRGFSLIETLLVLALFALFSVYLITLITDNASRTRAKALADKMTLVSEATKGYVKANYAQLMAQAPNPGSGALVIPVGRTSATGPVPGGPGGLNSIQGAGFLASNFIDRNSFNQTSAVLVRKCGCANNTLDVMITTVATGGGRVIPDSLLGLAANAMGAGGGFVPAIYPNATDSGMVLGSYGGWKTDIADWGPTATRPAAGTVQKTLAFEDGSLLADYLNRYDINIPDANRMHTDIDVNNNDLTRVKTISANTPTSEVGLTGSLRATLDIFARHGSFSGNVVANGTVRAGQDLRAGRDLAVANDASIGGTTTTGALQVNGNAVVNGNLDVKGKVLDLDANYINADAIVYKGSTTTWGKTKADVVRLGDVLPKMSGQYSYRVTPTSNRIRKPVCNSASPGDFSRARIMIYRHTESYDVIPNVPLNVQTSNSYVTAVTQNKNQSWVQIASAIVATDAGNEWHLNWLGDPASPTAERQALVQTFCYFG